MAYQTICAVCFALPDAPETPSTGRFWPPRNTVYWTIFALTPEHCRLDGIPFPRDRAKHPALRYCPLDERSRRMLRPYDYNYNYNCGYGRAADEASIRRMLRRGGQSVQSVPIIRWTASRVQTRAGAQPNGPQNTSCY